ncbi:MAG: Ig-like domain repeat protein, partial [Elusimicrobia bacterium]|nr:Ig-like domain repeat protein [Elusimicrobiota bacterium]
MKKILVTICFIVLIFIAAASASVEYQNKTETTESGIQIIISTPTGCITGDLLIAFLTKDGIDAISTNSDWNVICSSTPGEGNYVQVAWRIFQAGDTSWTWTSASETWLGEILCYRGHDAANPIYAVSTNSAISTQYPLAPSVDYTDLPNGSLVLQLYGADYDKYDTVPIQLTTRFSGAFGGPQGTCGAGGDKLVSGTGSTDTAEFGMTGVDDWVAVTVVIKAAPSPPENMNLDAVYTSSATLSWDINTDAIEYILEASTNTNFIPVFSSSSTTDVNITTLTVSSLWANTTYYFRAGNFIDGTTYWTTTTISTSTLANPITNAQIYALNESTVTLTWTALPQTPSSSTCEGYIIEASSTNFGVEYPGGIVYSSISYTYNTSALTISELNSNTTYWFRIGTYNWNYATNYVLLDSTATLSMAPNVSCNKSTETWTNTDEFVFTNELGWGGGGVEYYKYKWDQSVSPSDYPDTWSSGVKVTTATTEGSWYMHVKSYDPSGTSNPTTMDYGPYNYDSSSPTFSNFYSQRVNTYWVDTTQWNDDATPNAKINVQDSDYSGLRIGRTEIDPSSGTILLLHLNENTTDYSGYGNHGTLENGPGWVSTGTWKTGGGQEQILELDDASEQYVTADSVCNHITGTGKPFSFGCWVHPTQATERDAVLIFNGKTVGDLNMLWWAYTDGKFAYEDDDNPQVDSQNTFSLDWHFAMVTIDASNNGKLYVDGKEEANFTTDERPETGGYFSIGTEYDSYPNDGDHFTGFVDEVVVYNRALSANEVACLYNSGCVKYSTSGVDGTYIIDASTATTVTSGNNGTVSIEISTATSLPFHTSGTDCHVQFLISDMAGNVAESDKYAIKIDSIPPTAITNLNAAAGSGQREVDLTWTKSTDTVSGCDSYIIKYATFGIVNFATSTWWNSAIDITGGTVFDNESKTETFDVPLSTPLFHFAIRTLDNAGNLSDISNVPFVHPKDNDPIFSNFASQRVDGSWIDTTQWNDDDTPNAKVEVQDTDTGLRIGSQEVWPDTNTVLLLHMNESGLSDGATTYDSSGYGNNGTVYSATSITTTTWKSRGGTEEILYFDRSDDYIEVQNDESLNISGEFTIEAWVKVKEFNTNGGNEKDMIARRADYGNNEGFLFGTGESEIEANDKKPYLHLTNGTDWFWTSTNNPIKENEWYYIVGTRKGTLIKLYINGELDKSRDDFTGNIKPYEGLLYIGGNAEFNGLIDEVRILNHALSAEEVACRYNSGCVKYSTSSVARTWIIDPSTATTVTSGDNGTVSIEISSTVTSLPFHSSETDCQVQFLISDMAGNIAESNAYAIKIDSAPAPDDVQIDAVNISNVSMSWTNWACPDGYVVEASTNSNFIPVYKTSSTSDKNDIDLTVLDLISNTTYYLRAGSIFSDATSWMVSPEYLSTTTLCQVPGMPLINEVYTSSITITIGTGSNPWPTKYAIKVSSVDVSNSGKYVTANDGLLGDNAVWNSSDSWDNGNGQVWVGNNELLMNTTYEIVIIAKNWNEVEAVNYGNGTTTSTLCELPIAPDLLSVEQSSMSVRINTGSNS